MYKFPYLLIKKFLKTSIPEIKEHDWYKQQDSNSNKGALKVSPGLYYKFINTDTKSIGQGVQTGEVELELTLLTDNLYDDDKKVHDGTGIDHLSLVDKIHLKLSGHSDYISSLTEFSSLKDTVMDWKPFNSLDRTNIDHDFNNGSIMKTVMTYKFFAKDYSANKEWTSYVSETLSLTIENFEI